MIASMHSINRQVFSRNALVLGWIGRAIAIGQKGNFSIAGDRCRLLGASGLGQLALYRRRCAAVIEQESGSLARL